MKVYLSHGGGVNSWALYLYLVEQGEVPGEDLDYDKPPCRCGL